MREDKNQTGSRRKKEEETLRDELLAEVFRACMEEQLSFIPPEREIARMHTFSKEFEESMEELCRTKGREKKERRTELTRREFRHSFQRMAACILLMLLVGGACVGGYFLLDQGSSGSATSAAREESSTAGAAGAQGQESVAESGAASGQEADTAWPEETEFQGQTISLASEQELAESTETVKMLVSSPVLPVDAETVKVTIGNLGENPIVYHTDMELQVRIDGAWYVVPKKEGAAIADTEVTLEPGMAQDEEIFLTDYELDYEAEQYRAVTRVDGRLLGSQFRFETMEEGLEEVLEG